MLRGLALTLSWGLTMMLMATAQEVSPLDRMMELNRSGEWARAAQLAEQFLVTGGERPLAERCHAYANLAYSQTKLGQDAAAQATLTRFDKECRELPPGNWLPGFAARIRQDLAAPATADNPMRSAPPSRTRPDEFWQTASPRASGVDPQALEQHRLLCERTGADACLVVHGGKIVQELYSRRYRAPMYAMSSTKSITGLLVGMLIDDGKIKSLDAPVCDYISEWCEGPKAKVTLRHLLTMTSGLPARTTDGVGFVGDKDAFVIAQPLTSEPGAEWNYSNEGVQLLSPILDKAAGEPIQDYARRRLFGPLGMRSTRLHLDELHHAWTYADMVTTPRDMARIGLLMLNKGMWQKRRILSEAWVTQSTLPSQNLNRRYGLLWWLYERPEGFAALGYLNTNLYVFPGRDLIVVRMQSKPLNLRASYEPVALSLFEKMVRP